MFIIILLLFGVIFGSFINALVWRLRMQEEAEGKSSKKYSISRGRSMCVHCKHELATRDLIPVASWLMLKGKCRYCKKPISAQYPAVELATGVLFASSYVFWPYTIESLPTLLLFVSWLVALVIFIALAVYDIRWYELPDRLVFPLIGVAVLFAVCVAFVTDDATSLFHALFGGTLLFSLFWTLFQVSRGEWIGGGDVKIVFALGVFAGGALEAFLVIFFASLLGTVLALPGLVQEKGLRGVKIPFGPYLLAATIVVVIFGDTIISWYQNLFVIS